VVLVNTDRLGEGPAPPGALPKQPVTETAVAAAAIAASTPGLTTRPTVTNHGLPATYDGL